MATKKKKVPRERKTRHMMMRVSATEKRMLVTLSEASSLSMADVVRQAIRGAYARHQVERRRTE
jgi:hypothetical protein